MYGAVDIGCSSYTNVWYSGYWLFWLYTCLVQWILVVLVIHMCLVQWILVVLAIQKFGAVDIGCSIYTNVWCSGYWLFWQYIYMVQWILVVLAIEMGINIMFTIVLFV